MFLRFFIDQGDSARSDIEGDHQKFVCVAKRYLFGMFIIHVIPCIPFHIYKLPFQPDEGNLLYLIKLMRLERGIKLFDVNKIMRSLKNYMKNK